MAINSLPNRVVYAGNGSSATFGFQYEFSQQSDLNVYLYDTILGGITTLVLNTDYSVTGTPNSQGIYSSGGNVVFNSSPVATSLVVIVRNPQFVQNFTLQQNQNIPSVALTNQLDYLTLLAQRLEDQASRSVTLPDGLGSSFNTTLPSTLLLNPGSPIIINSSGTGLVVGSSVFFQTGTAGYVLTGNGPSSPASYQPLSLTGSSVSGTLSLSNGGTGGLAPQEWGVVFASSATQLATTNPGPSGVPLISVASSAPAFLALPLGSAVSGQLPIANGGTNATTANAGFNNLSPMTSPGDMITAGSSGQAIRLAAGANGFVLTSTGTGTPPTWQVLGGGTTLLANGSVTAPSLAFINSGSSGLYYVGATEFAMAVAGVQVMDFALSAGGFGNIGMGGGASTNDGFPLLLQRNLAGVLTVDVSNTSTNAANASQLILNADNANTTGQITQYSTSQALDAYAGRLVLLPNNNSNGITLHGGVTASGDVRIYSNGFASTNRNWQWNVDYSAQIMQAISTPTTPSTGGMKVFQSTTAKFSTVNSAGVLSSFSGVNTGDQGPMTTWGDIIYSGSGNIATRLAAGTSGNVLQTGGAGAAPSWVAVATGSSLTNPMTTLGDMISGGAAGVAQRLTGSVTNSSAILVTTGSSGVATSPVWRVFAPPQITNFLVSGSGFTYTVPTGALYLKVRVAGGGGGSGGSGSTLPSGSSGIQSFFGTGFVISNGGTGGTTLPGAGGIAVIGSSYVGLATGLSLQGGSGTSGSEATTVTTQSTGGVGGVNPLGGSGSGITSLLSGGAGAPNTGAGGGGGGTNALANGFGGAGGGAGGYNEVIISGSVLGSSAGVFAVQVGGGGVAGGAGTSGAAGGAGGSGLVSVEAHFQ